MKSWLILLGGLLVWAVHFFGVYAIGEIDPRPAWVVILTLVCVAADLWLLRWFFGLSRKGHFTAWRRSIAVAGVGLSLVAVVWQSLPAVAG